MPTNIVWYKPTDLRIHDHQPLCQAHLDSISSSSAGNATTTNNNVLHVLVLDPSLGYGKTAPLSSFKKLPRIGRIRAKFLIEAIQDLHTKLVAAGQTLLVYINVSTTTVFQHLLQSHGKNEIQAVYTHGPEFCTQEQQIEYDMKHLLQPQGIQVRMFWGWTLHHPDDLMKKTASNNNNNKSKLNNKKKRNGSTKTTTTTTTTPTSSSRSYQPPERYKDFLNQVCKNKRSICFRNPGPKEPISWANPAAAATPGVAAIMVQEDNNNSNIKNIIRPMDPTKLSIQDIVRPEVFEEDDDDDDDDKKPLLEKQEEYSSSTTMVTGGETSALNAMNDYIWKHDKLKNYVGSSDSMTPGKHNAINSTSGLSPYLAFGCLSPRTLYSQILKYEKQRQRNRSTYWIFHELVFRDYFVFCCLYRWSGKPGRLFQLNGPDNASADHPWRRDGIHAQKLFNLWRTGQTGYPMVDAGMRQLATTGQMPHLVRQMVAGFLVRDLRLDWRWGAEWFERCLLDYTPDANYGNWVYRILPIQQLMPLETKHLTSLELISWPVVHDPHLEYTLRWVPELTQVLQQQRPDFDDSSSSSSSNNNEVLVREPWRNDDDYRKLDEIDVKPHKDSPLWIMSVNRSNWPEYQQMMTGKAYRLQWKSKRIGDVVHKERCPYPYPIVAPLELQILHDKIPLDHSWGDTNSSSISGNSGTSTVGTNNNNRGNSNKNNNNNNRNRHQNRSNINKDCDPRNGQPSSSTKQASNGRKRPRNRGRKQGQPIQ